MASKSWSPSGQKVRVMFLRPSMGSGGADRVTLTLLQHLDRARFEPELALLKKQGAFLADIPDDVPVHGLDVRIIRSVGPLRHLLRCQQPDVLFSTSSGTNVPAILAKLLGHRQTRVIISERNTVQHGALTAKRRFIVWLKKKFYEKADGITAVSEGVKQDMVETLGLPSERVLTVYNPVVSDELIAQAGQPLDHPWFVPGAPPMVLGVGRFVAQKDFETLIRAFAKVRLDHEVRLMILGEGPLRPDLERLVAALGLEADVALPGFDKNPFRYMARCAIFVLSSLHEGLPGVLIQAMACGAVPVATDCPFGPSEIIGHGEDGFLVPVRDSEAMAHRISYLLDNPDLRARMAGKARLNVRRFDTDTVLRNYQEAIEATRPRHVTQTL